MFSGTLHRTEENLGRLSGPSAPSQVSATGTLPSASVHSSDAQASPKRVRQTTKDNWVRPTAKRGASKLISREFSAQVMPVGANVDSAASRGSSLQDFQSNTLSALLHDARNMVAAIDLYCDLLDEPGVISSSFHHYAGELRLVAGSSRRLLEQLALFECVTGSPNKTPSNPGSVHPIANPRVPLSPSFPLGKATPTNFPLASVHDGRDLQTSGYVSASLVPQNPIARMQRNADQTFQPSAPVVSLASELRANHHLLSALAGPSITVGLSIQKGNRPLAITPDDLTRVLVNLTRNAAEAMPGGGHIQIDLKERFNRLYLSFSDTGGGIPEHLLETVFDSGYTSQIDPGGDSNAFTVRHRGLGLAIVRSIVSSAGGSVSATNRTEKTRVIYATDEVPNSASECRNGAILLLEFPIPA
jgi:hypothetical protein